MPQLHVPIVRGKRSCKPVVRVTVCCCCCYYVQVTFRPASLKSSHLAAHRKQGAGSNPYARSSQQSDTGPAGPPGSQGAGEDDRVTNGTPSECGMSARSGEWPTAASMMWEDLMVSQQGLCVYPCALFAQRQLHSTSGGMLTFVLAGGQLICCGPVVLRPAMLWACCTALSTCDAATACASGRMPPPKSQLQQTRHPSCASPAGCS